MDVAIASCRTLPDPDHDEAPLLEALAAAGIDTGVMAWDDPAADFSQARLTVLRSTWNYPSDRDGFLLWAARTAEASQLCNPLPVVRWNSHKRYLLELETQGVAIAPTELVPRGSSISLAEVLAGRRWHDVIVKPAVGAASFRTRRFGADQLDAGEGHLRDLSGAGDVLVQRYLPSVEDHGERSVIWIAGELTHAVRKRRRLEGDDERVEPDAVDVAPAEADLARRAIAAVNGPIMYARIDMAPGPDGSPVLMELELIEPSLYFPQCREALDLFTAAIKRALEDGRGS